jgi:hypothetical protein
MRRAIVSLVFSLALLVLLVLHVTGSERHGERFWRTTVLATAGTLAFG